MKQSYENDNYFVGSFTRISLFFHVISKPKYMILGIEQFDI